MKMQKRTFTPEFKAKVVLEVLRYIKRTHRQKDFNAVKAGEPPIRLTRQVGKVTYMLYLVVEDE
jgi:hypothetical protein